MAEEEEDESLKLEGSSNLGKSSSRKFQNKQKKVPQRGLGVAQLEKIRIEEQRKKVAAAMAATSPPTSVSQAAVSSESDAPEIGGRRHTTAVLMPRPGDSKLWNSSDFGTELDHTSSDFKIGVKSSWRIGGNSDAMFPMPTPLPRIHNYLNHPSLVI